MKRFALLLACLGLVSTAVGCCGSGCGRPMLGMAAPYESAAMYTPTMTAAAPSCSCGY